MTTLNPTNRINRMMRDLEAAANATAKRSAQPTLAPKHGAASAQTSASKNEPTLSKVTDLGFNAKSAWVLEHPMLAAIALLCLIGGVVVASVAWATPQGTQAAAPQRLSPGWPQAASGVGFDLSLPLARVVFAGQPLDADAVAAESPTF